MRMSACYANHVWGSSFIHHQDLYVCDDGDDMVEMDDDYYMIIILS